MKFNYTPLEVLAIIEHVQKCLKRTFSDEEIQNGILRDLIIEEDYDIIKVVSTYHIYPLKYPKFLTKRGSQQNSRLTLGKTTKLCLRPICHVLADARSQSTMPLSTTHLG